MKTIKQILCAAALGCLTISTISAAEVEQITDGNRDGEAQSYRVKCSDLKIGSVVVVDRPRQYCAYPAFGRQLCREDWTVETAAAYVCSQG